MMYLRLAAIAASLGACGSGSAPRPIVNTAGSTGTLAETLERAKATHGDVLLVSTESGINAYSPDLDLVAKISTTAGRYLRPDAKNRALFFFVDRRLVRLDLTNGQERTVATLPALKHMCFDGDGEGVNPLDYIQRDEDAVVDVAKGFACLNVQDRNVNMMSVAIRYRIALDTGAVARQTTLTLDDCREPGEPDRAEGPCDAGDLTAGPDLVSPSKRWELVRDPDLGDQGDYIYSATFMTDSQTKQSYAVRADGIAPFDYAAARAAGKAPEGTCVLPYEATVRWFPHTDVAIIGGCSDAGALLVRPPANVRPLLGSHFAFY